MFMADDAGQINWLMFTSYKCQRMVRSVSGGETYTFNDCFCAAYSITYEVQKILGRKAT